MCISIFWEGINCHSSWWGIHHKGVRTPIVVTLCGEVIYIMLLTDIFPAPKDFLVGRKAQSAIQMLSDVYFPIDKKIVVQKTSTICTLFANFRPLLKQNASVLLNKDRTHVSWESVSLCMRPGSCKPECIVSHRSYLSESPFKTEGLLEFCFWVIVLDSGRRAVYPSNMMTYLWSGVLKFG